MNVLSTSPIKSAGADGTNSKSSAEDVDSSGLFATLMQSEQVQEGKANEEAADSETVHTQPDQEVAKVTDVNVQESETQTDTEQRLEAGQTLPTQASGKVAQDIESDSVEIDLLSQINAAKKQNTSVTRHPSGVSEAVKQVLHTSANQQTQSSEYTEQGQIKVESDIKVGELVTQSKGTNVDKLYSNAASMSPTAGEGLDAKDTKLLGQVEAALTANEKGRETALTASQLTDNQSKSTKSAVEASLHQQLETDEQAATKLESELRATKTQAAELTALLGTKGDDGKSKSALTTITEKLNNAQVAELKSVLKGEIDVYKASPEVQKVFAELMSRELVVVSQATNPAAVLQAAKLNKEVLSNEVVDEAGAEHSEEKPPLMAEPKQSKNAATSGINQQEKSSTYVERLKSDDNKSDSDKYSKESNSKLLKEEVVSKEAEIQPTESKALESAKAEKANNIFSQINANLKVDAVNSQTETADLNSFKETMKQVEQLQHSDSRSQQANATSKAGNESANLQQAINIARNDAAKELQQRVGMMMNLNNKEVEIRLDPPELGAMQIRIKTDAEQAQVNFVVQNQQAKEALEQSMPRLREMLAEQGIELGDSQISQQQQEAAEQETRFAGQGGAGGNESEEQAQQDEIGRVKQSGNSDSAIDYYA